MGVIAGYRRKGMGRQLLKAAVEHAARVGITRIELEVFSSNTAAISLYESFGFETECIRKRVRYLDGVWEDMTQMVLLPPDVSDQNRRKKTIRLRAVWNGKAGFQALDPCSSAFLPPICNHFSWTCNEPEPPAAHPPFSCPTTRTADLSVRRSYEFLDCWNGRASPVQACPRDLKWWNYRRCARWGQVLFSLPSARTGQCRRFGIPRWSPIRRTCLLSNVQADVIALGGPRTKQSVQFISPHVIVS